jgi:hypothetical protein
MSNLRLINETITTVDRQTSVSLTDCFTNDFNIYKIVVNAQTYNATAQQLDVRLINSSGSVIADSNYDYAFLQLRSNASFNEVRATNQTNWDRPFNTSDLPPETNQGIMYLFNPADSSSYTFAISQGVSMNGSGSLRSGKFIGVHTSQVKISGFNIFMGSDSIGIGTSIKVYGIRVDT